MEHVHLVIIGAGWHGITMAKTYHEAYPDATLCILDCGSSLGGVWATERLYKGLRTNNVLGSYEFSDFAMTPERYGVDRGQHIPGHVVHKYLCDAVEYFDLAHCFRLETKVKEATLREDGSWLLRFVHRPGATVCHIITDKLVVATGLTSEPSIPIFPGQSRFKGPIIHSRELTARSSELAAAKHVVVIGGNKSAWDVCYSVASRGAHAHLCMRPSGGGPSWVWPVVLWPFKTSLARLSSTRFFTLFDPWPFAQHEGWQRKCRNFLHQSKLGRAVTKLFWDVLGGCVRNFNAYASHPTTLQLIPWYSMYWMGNSLSVHNYDSSWFELARHDKITVHIADVLSLSEESVQLSNDTLPGIDAVICCTGWKAEPTFRFSPEGVLDGLGLPSSRQPSDSSISKARELVADTRPFLRHAPVRSSTAKLRTSGPSDLRNERGPYRLHRGMVPCDSDFLQSRNIAFLGVGLSLHAILVAQVQALWIMAFFEDRLPSLRTTEHTTEGVVSEAIAHSEYYRLRRPRSVGGHGGTFPDRVFECVPYVDLLMRDMGLPTERKAGFLRDLFEQYTLRDYSHLVQEWMRVNSQKDKAVS